MRTANNSRILLTSDSTAGNTSLPLPSNPQNADEVVAINLGSANTFTVLGTISGATNLALNAGESAILVYTSSAGWVATFSPTGGVVAVPISIAHGGTGIDGTDLLDFASTTGDSATTTFSLSATDTNLNKSTVSLSIELPGDGVSAGDAVLRTGSGTERIRVFGTAETGIAIPASDGKANFAISATSGGNADFTIRADQTDGSTPQFDLSLGTGQFNLTLYANPNDATAPYTLLSDGTIESHSLTGPSALFQTSATDGSNANATVVVKRNTAQTSSLQEWQDSAGNVLGNVVAMDEFSGEGAEFGFPATPTASGSSFLVDPFGNHNLGVLAVNAGTLGVSGIEAFAGAEGNPTTRYAIYAEQAGNDYPAIYAAGFGTGADGLYAQSKSGVSGRFQTAVDDGSNTAATTEILGNLLQTSNLTNWRGTDGTSIVASVGIGGNVDAASYSVGGTPGLVTFSGAVTNITVVNGLITAAS